MPDRSSSSRRARPAGWLLPSLAALLLVLAGCSSPGSVDDYNADTEANFLQACEEANGDGLSEVEVRELCGCWYDLIEENISFDEFEQIEDDIRTALDEGTLQDDDDLEALSEDFHDVVTDPDCVTVGP